VQNEAQISAIIDEALTPRFKAGDYAGGLDAAVDQLAARIKGEPLPSVTPADGAGSDPRGDGFQWWDLAIFLFVAVPVVAGSSSGSSGAAWVRC
jgi:uncharacterized protein